MALLFALACLAGLVSQIRRAGWSIRRADRRGVYWCGLGMAFGVMVTCKPFLPSALAAIAVGGLGAGILR